MADETEQAAVVESAPETAPEPTPAPASTDTVGARRVRWKNVNRDVEPLELPEGVYWHDGTELYVSPEQWAVLEATPGFTTVSLEQVPAARVVHGGRVSP